MKRDYLFIVLFSVLLCCCSGSSPAGPDLSTQDMPATCPCALGSYCDPATNTCKPGCTDNSQCGAGSICDTTAHMCVPGCALDSDCTGAGEICDGTNKMCRAGCRSNAGCASGQGCNLALNECQAQCTMDGQCSAGQICDPVASLCRAGCRVNTDCSGGQSCDMASLLCVTQCSMDSQCGAGQVCDPNKSYCRSGCHMNSDCSTGQLCNSSLVCVTKCTMDSQCGAGQVCDTSQSQCKPAPGFPGCVGLQCSVQYNCPAFAGPTTLTGTVAIPAGTLPVSNAKVFIPSGSVPPPPASGATCMLCSSVVPKDAVTSTTTDINGNFTLTNVPSGSNIPVIVQLGKWRRVATVSRISDCTTTALDATLTRLPQNHTEGNIPKIAISTGSEDAVECLLRKFKLGVDDQEFTTETGTGRVNMYAGNGANKFSAGLGGASFTAEQPVPAPSWWDTQANWNQYDIVMLSCEGAQNLTTKSTAARSNLQTYINVGGRVFASHWHNVWIQAGPMPLSTVATFPNMAVLGNIATDIVTTFAQGMNLKQWLANVYVSALNGNGQLVVGGAQNTVGTVNTMLAQPWVTYQQPPNQLIQHFSFHAPVGAPAANQCGQMAFSDLHVSTGTDTSTPGIPFPNGCITTAYTPQEKFLIFTLLDLTNCL